MDDRLCELDRAVAQAADAWLGAPSDWRVYAYLVEAIGRRRAYVQPQIEDPPATRMTDAATQPDEVLDALADRCPVTVVGALLDGGPEAALDRLRQPTGPTAEDHD